MPTFAYTAYNRAGRVVEGELVAESVTVAREQIAKGGLAPMQIKLASQTNAKWWQREVYTIRKQRRVPLALFTQELSSFLSAGMRISEALESIGETGTDAVGQFSGDLAGRVVTGQSLSQALRTVDAGIPAGYIAMIEAGEASGKLADVLKVLSEGLEREEAFAARLRGALTYPAILLCAALGAVFVAIFGVVPRLAPLLEGQTSDMALPARAMLGLSSMSGGVWATWGIGIVLLGLACIVLAQRPGVAKKLSLFFLRLPMIGALLKTRRSAIYCRSLGMMLSQGVGLVDAMRISARTLPDSPARDRLLQASEDVREGAAFSDVITAIDVLPASSVRLMVSGDRAGRLSQMTLNAAIRLEADVERQADRLATLLPTIMTLVMGVIVALVIASVFSVILSVNEVAV